MNILPPNVPLEFPLKTQQVCDILGISKSTLIRWEKEDKIPKAKHELNGLSLERAFYAEDMLEILRAMKEIQDGPYQTTRYRWLDGKDLDTPGCRLRTPTGYTISTQHP